MKGPTPKGHSDGVWRKGRAGSNNFQAAWLLEMDRKLWLVDDGDGDGISASSASIRK